MYTKSPNDLRGLSSPLQAITEEVRLQINEENDTNRGIELDVFIPSLQLAFEYSGSHHYEDQFVFGQRLSSNPNDEAKAAVCHAKGFRILIIVAVKIIASISFFILLCTLWTSYYYEN
jgi:hypothetical protein